MRRFTVNWQAFTDALPPLGAPIVVEIERVSRDREGKVYRHRSECVTGTFNGPGAIWAWIRRKNDMPTNVKMTSRWYLQGSEKLETRRP